MPGGGGGSILTCQLPAARATATTWCHDLMIRWSDSLIGWSYDGVLVGWPDVKVIVVVESLEQQRLVTMTATETVIVQTSALQQLVHPLLFWVKASVKKRWPPSCGLRPECNGVQQTFLTLAQTSGNSGKCMWLGRQELKTSLDSGGGGDRHCNATEAGSGTSHRQWWWWSINTTRQPR